MAVQEDLSSLFAKNLTLNPSKPPPPPTPSQDDNKIVYISQHYTHSAHVTPQQQTQQDEPVQRPSSEPPQSDLQDLELLLRSHGVNTAALSFSQVELFRSADDAQKGRLIQLWTICPPTNPTDNPTLTWSSTTVEQEEMLARRRFESQQHHEQQQQQQAEPVTEVVMSLDGTETETVLSNSAPDSVQSGDGRWMPQSHHYMEPYMQSGYEELAMGGCDASAQKADEYCLATDPVYMAPGAMFDLDRQAWMEDQYGSFVGWGNDEDMLF